MSGFRVLVFQQSEVFEWRAHPDSLPMFFDVAAMREYARAEVPEGVEVCGMELTASIVKHCLEHRGVSEARAMALPPEALQDPAIGCELPDGTMLTVDGHHRLVAWYRRGFRVVPVRLFARDTWPRFLRERL